MPDATIRAAAKPAPSTTFGSDEEALDAFGNLVLQLQAVENLALHLESVVQHFHTAGSRIVTTAGHEEAPTGIHQKRSAAESATEGDGQSGVRKQAFTVQRGLLTGAIYQNRDIASIVESIKDAALFGAVRNFGHDNKDRLLGLEGGQRPPFPVSSSIASVVGSGGGSEVQTPLDGKVAEGSAMLGQAMVHGFDSFVSGWGGSHAAILALPHAAANAFVGSVERTAIVEHWAVDATTTFVVYCKDEEQWNTIGRFAQIVKLRTPRRLALVAEEGPEQQTSKSFGFHSLLFQPTIRLGVLAVGSALGGVLIWLAIQRFPSLTVLVPRLKDIVASCRFRFSHTIHSGATRPTQPASAPPARLHSKPHVPKATMRHLVHHGLQAMFEAIIVRLLEGPQDTFIDEI
ncbi:hypothetical protein NMY22_g6899 [Coprinellus aureogranulatus]|nr:hypothetical protein NMY22_g6899 [Coprinellus aureogranulatus]